MRTASCLTLALALLPAAAPAAAPDAGPQATPFVSARPGAIVVPVMLGGRGPYRFLLDTGSTHTAVTAGLAAAVDARPVARTTLRAAGGTIDCLVVALPRVAVGGAVADDITATALPVARGAALGSADGILGQDFLARFSYTLDFRRGRVVWHDGDYVAPGVAVPLVATDGRFLVELPGAAGRNEARAVRRFVPDSATETLVLYCAALARELVIEWRPSAATLESLTGPRAVRTALVDGIRVGPATLDRQIAAVVLDADPCDGGGDADGLLPLHLFAAVSFNARRRSLVIQPS